MNGLEQYGFSAGGDMAPRTNMKHILGKEFHLKGIRDTPFEDKPDAITVSTSEEFPVNYTKKDGTVVDGKFHEFYVTWKVPIEKLQNKKLREDVANGSFKHALKLVQRTKQSGGTYYDFDAA